MEEYRKYEPIFGSWYISRLIGRGSFGKVFEITREEFGARYVSALKIITIPQDDDDIKSRLSEGTGISSVTEYYNDILREIVNENEIMAQLKGNSNIVSYEDHQIIPHDDGIGYDILIRMELLTPLLDRIMIRRLDEQETVQLGIDICKALELCHSKNIIHRDIKPQNIFISDNNDFKLGDFGIARTIEKTTSGMSKKGTYKYMAPEVFRGENYDGRVDIYSLGIVLYTLLNGNRGPFLAAPPVKVSAREEEEANVRRLRGEEIPDPRDGGLMLKYIIKKACAFRAENRYSSAAELRRDLENYMNNYIRSSSQGATVIERGPETTVPANDGPEWGGLQYSGQQSTNTGSYGRVMPRMPLEQHDVAQIRYRREPGKVLTVILAGVLITALTAGGIVWALTREKESDSSDTSIRTITAAENESTAPEEKEQEEVFMADEDEREPAEETPQARNTGNIPDAAFSYNDHHYEIVNIGMRWDQAQEECARCGGHLAYIETEEEQAMIRGFIEQTGTQKYHYWLGGTNRDNEDEWHWLSGERIPLSGDDWGYQNWEDGKPNNSTEAAGYTGEENYLELQTTNKRNDYMTWNDIDMDGVALGYEEADEYCSTKYFGYICEWEY